MDNHSTRLHYAQQALEPGRAAAAKSCLSGYNPRVVDMLARGRQVLASQPFSVLLGAELLAFSEGKAEIRIPIRDELKQQHGFVHGGVLAYVADNALTFAGGSVLGPGVVTSEFKINYVRPALGGLIVARAAVVYAGRTQAVCRCDVFVQQGREDLCATAQGTIVLLSPSAGSTAVVW